VTHGVLAIVDYYGLAAVIAAITGLVGAIATLFTHVQVGKAKDIAQDTNEKVTGPNNQSIASMIDDADVTAHNLSGTPQGTPPTPTQPRADNT
jgi:hypothetical protein